MSLAAPTQRELDELVAAVVDETITAEQTARLQQWLHDSGVAQQHFVRAMGLHASLYGYASEGEQEEDKTAKVNRSTWRAALGRAARLVTRPTPFSLTVAALVIGLLITAMAFILAPSNPSQHRARVDELAATRIVAKLSRLQEAEWAEGQVGSAAGSHLLAGHRMQLARGLAEVTFNDGAVVVLEGPARFVVNDTGVATLHQGRLRAYVPQRALGFKLTTPVMEIVDLGTEFGVGVDSQEATEVHVLQGSVAVSPVGQPSSDGRVVLHRGQAWRINANGGPGRAVASQPQCFAIALTDPLVAVFQEGRVNSLTGGTYDGVDDVQLIQWQPDGNYGMRTDFDVGQMNGGRAHTLLRFNLSSLQGKVDRLVSVTLRIHPNTGVFYFPWPGEGNIELYRVSDANAAWREGTFAGGAKASAGDGEPTWNHLCHPDLPWPGAPGASRRGVDFGAKPLASAAYVPRTGYPLDFRVSGDLEFVRDWIDGQRNGGFLLREVTGAASNRINFHSSESTTVAARPQLIVTYLPVTENASGENSIPP